MAELLLYSRPDLLNEGVSEEGFDLSLVVILEDLFKEGDTFLTEILLEVHEGKDLILLPPPEGLPIELGEEEQSGYPKVSV